MTINPEIPFLNSKGELATPTVLSQIDDRTKATMRADLPALADELGIGGDALPAGGLPGDFLTRTASGYRWTPPLYDDGATVSDLSGLYFIDNGDGTSSPTTPSAFVDNADGTSTLIGG